MLLLGLCGREMNGCCCVRVLTFVGLVNIMKTVGRERSAEVSGNPRYLFKTSTRVFVEQRAMLAMFAFTDDSGLLRIRSNSEFEAKAVDLIVIAIRTWPTSAMGY